MVGWRQLKDGLKLAWLLGFQFVNSIMFPGLFPGLALATPKNRVFSGNPTLDSSLPLPLPLSIKRTAQLVTLATVYALPVPATSPNF